ncbi:DUF4287 domain-containing protein [Nocardia brasiliensis]|nr:DUF4287 domain-containing protein [Nocardia brasiliensis]
MVEWLKSEHAMGDGHATALAQYHLYPAMWPS